MRNFLFKFIYSISGIYFFFCMLLMADLMISEVPDQIYVRRGEESNYQVEFPFVISDWNEELGNQKKLCSFLGIVPIKEVTFCEVDEIQEVYVSGEIVGLYTSSNGVFVIDTCALESVTGELLNPAKDCVLQGDYVLAIDGHDVHTKEEMVKIIEMCEGEEVILSLYRNGQMITKYVTPVKTVSGYKLGIWVKDDLAGIGTLTFVTETGEFGALGHGMSNGENQDLFVVDEGDLYTSTVLGIEEGKKGEPGEIKGMIPYGKGNHMGDIVVNSSTGIYGQMDMEDLVRYRQQADVYTIGYKQEVKEGHAQIISEISGERKAYDIEITYVDYLTLSSYKGIHITVTDPELLDLTGGIVQGMSGSPIIQDGKLVGAVTHVLVNDPTRGYGIFIENMLEAAG